jgi:hypothetical protein
MRLYFTIYIVEWLLVVWLCGCMRMYWALKNKKQLWGKLTGYIFSLNLRAIDVQINSAKEDPPLPF